MKDNNIDKLFQERLSGWEKSPPPMTWDKINDQLHKEKTPFFWWHRAAIIAILCLSGALVFTLTNRTANKQKAITFTVESEGQVHQDKQEESDPSQGKIATLDLKDIPTETHASKEGNIDSIKATTAGRVAQANKHISNKLSSNVQNSNANQVQAVEPIELTHAIDYEPKVAIEEVAQIAEARKALPVTIEFKAGKKTPEASTLAHTPNSLSPLRKLTEKLREIKHAEIDLAHLRQAKDDLLAFNSNRDNSKPSEE